MRLPRIAPIALMAIVAVACGSGSGGAQTDPSLSPSPTVGPTPTVVPTPSIVPTPADFAVTLLPPEEPVAAREAIPGEKVSFLVKIAGPVSGSGAATESAFVDVAATAVGAKVIDIRPRRLTPGVVGEVWVVPDATSVEAVARVSFTFSRAGVTHTDARSIAVRPMVDERAADAAPYFAQWSRWLASAHPELGISASTRWQPEFVSTFLVVSHYSYYSEDWELHLSWHNMIPPYDWTQIDLRHRGEEMAPSLAFRIDSVKGKTAPHPVTPPDAVMR